MEELRPKYLEFTKGDLKAALMMKLRTHSEKHFGPESKMNTVIVRKLIECYTEQTALGDLGLLQSIGNDQFSFASVKPLGPWKQPSVLHSAYRAS